MVDQATGKVVGVSLNLGGGEQVNFNEACARTLEYPARMYAHVLPIDAILS